MGDEEIGKRFGSREYPSLKPSGTVRAKERFLAVAVPVIEAATLVMVLVFVWWML